MKVLSHDEAELTKDEQAAQTYFNQQLDLGSSTSEAVAKTKLIWAALDPKFYEWLGA